METVKNENKRRVRSEKLYITPPDQWGALNRILKAYKVVNLGLVLTCFSLCLLALTLYHQDPIVVVTGQDERSFLSGKRNSVQIGESEIKQVVKKYIEYRYSWETLVGEVILKSISPLVTRGLERKMNQVVKDLKKNQFRGKKTKQSVANIQVLVTEKSVIATFDKILRIENIPIVIPSQLSVAMIPGPRTEWNPSGVYINGLIENGRK